jgi:hypothetical protein
MPTIGDIIRTAILQGRRSRRPLSGTSTSSDVARVDPVIDTIGNPTPDVDTVRPVVDTLSNPNIASVNPVVDTFNNPDVAPAPKREPEVFRPEKRESFIDRFGLRDIPQFSKFISRLDDFNRRRRNTRFPSRRTGQGRNTKTTARPLFKEDDNAII